MFQDFAARELVAPRHARAIAAADEAADLICRYPNLSEVELARLINLFDGLSAVDVAMIRASSEALGRK